MGIFSKQHKPVPEPPGISAAEHLNIPPPKLTPEHAAGLDAAARISQQQHDSSLARYEAHREARKKASDAYEDFLWAKVVERNRHAIG
jgi:hypothetical protein